MNSPTPPFVHCCSVSLVSEPFLFTFSHSLSVSVPSRLSPGATAFTWPLHVTRSPAKTPRMPRSGPPLFPTLLNFRQKKRKGRERRRWVWERERNARGEINEQSEHVGPGECAAASQSHSFCPHGSCRCNTGFAALYSSNQEFAWFLQALLLVLITARPVCSLAVHLTNDSSERQRNQYSRWWNVTVGTKQSSFWWHIWICCLPL